MLVASRKSSQEPFVARYQKATYGFATDAAGAAHSSSVSTRKRSSSTSALGVMRPQKGTDIECAAGRLKVAAQARTVAPCMPAHDREGPYGSPRNNLSASAFVFSCPI